MSNTKYSNIVFRNKVINFEWVFIISLLVLSVFSTTTLAIALVMLLLLLMQGDIGAIKILNIITLRTIISPEFAININTFQNFKWIIIFTCSIYLLLGYKKLDENTKKRLRGLMVAIGFYGLYTIFSSFLTSTLPTIAITKFISYAIVFLAIVIGVSLTNNRISWLNWLAKMFTLLLIFSIPLIFLSVGYINGIGSFQGITNQPNTLGIVSVSLIAILLAKLQLREGNRIYNYLLIIITIFIVILSESRTSLVSAAILILVYIIFINIKLFTKIIFYNVITVTFILYIIINNQIISNIKSFLYKGQENILFSRMAQIEGLIDNFLRNPIFGSGFSVPVTQYRSFAFSSEYIVEPGNIILAVLSYGGILGMLFFVNYIIKILKLGLHNFKCTNFLYISPFLISMGEMVFFSSNGIGIWMYMLLAIYIYSDIYKNTQKFKLENSIKKKYVHVSKDAEIALEYFE